MAIVQQMPGVDDRRGSARENTNTLSHSVGRVSAMDTKQDIELTIRTATLIKSLSQLVGARDAQLAKLMFIESVEQFGALGKFIDKCNGVGKGESQ